jgi:flagellar FliJ protein
MSDLKSLALAVEVAERRRDQAEQAWQQTRRNLQFAQDQQDQLNGYANETDLRWTTASAVNLSAEVMNHHRHFMGRLNHAIELQEGVMQDLRQKVDAAHAHYVQQSVRLKALEHLQTQRLNERARVAARREQKDMDELAMRMHARQARRAEETGATL